jgi:hypothetical protein
MIEASSHEASCLNGERRRQYAQRSSECLHRLEDLGQYPSHFIPMKAASVRSKAQSRHDRRPTTAGAIRSPLLIAWIRSVAGEGASVVDLYE